MGAFTDFFQNLFSSDFMPHGHCFFWRPEILWLHVISDGLITAAYYSIPLTLLYFLRKRPGLKLAGLVLMFGAFIMACGTTHLLAIWDLWNSAYRLEGVVKAVTAALSVATAIVTLKLAPQAVRIATPEESDKVNSQLQQEIEARKEAERKLQALLESERLASEAKLKSFFEAAPQGILAMSSDGRIRLVNRRAEEMFGYSRAELLGEPLEMLMPERFQAAHRAGRDGFFASPHTRFVDADAGLRGLRKDGAEFPIQISISFVEQPEGPLALALVSDISRRLRNEAAIRASEAKLRSVLEAVAQGIVAVDSGGTIQMVNRSTEELFGYTRQELVGSRIEMLLPERYREAHAKHRGSYFEEPRMRAMGAGLELSGRRNDGTEFPLEIGLSSVETDGGTWALGVISDITDRKRADDQLARAHADLAAREEQFRSYLEAAPQAILAVDAAGRIVLVNRRTEEIFGYSREELITMPLSTLLPERYRAVHASHRASYFERPGLRSMGQGRELSGRRKSGDEFPVEVGLNYVDTSQGRLALGLITDITERKRAETELARAAEELRRTNQELEQFTYAASHDLQEPLRMVTNYLQLLDRRARAKLDETDLEFMNYALDGAKRMKGLIQDLLRLSRAGTQKLDFRIGTANLFVEQAMLNLKAAVDECGAAVTWDDLPDVLADTGLMTQVFQNLIGNAIKFQRAGERPEVHIAASKKDAEWVFAVRDNGIGIDRQHSQRIFQMFERLHHSEQYPGSGVGLAIVQRIIERHGGRIWVESEMGRGSTFYFTLSAKSLLPAAVWG